MDPSPAMLSTKGQHHQDKLWCSTCWYLKSDNVTDSNFLEDNVDFQKRHLLRKISQQKQCFFYVHEVYIVYTLFSCSFCQVWWYLSVVGGSFATQFEQYPWRLDHHLSNLTLNWSWWPKTHPNRRFLSNTPLGVSNIGTTSHPLGTIWKMLLHYCRLYTLRYKVGLVQ